MSDSKLYVGNLSFDTDEATLREKFAPLGTVVSASVITDRDTGRSRGFAFVEMSNAEEAKTAIEKLDGATVDGRALRVNKADDKPRRSGGGGGGGGRGGGGGYGGGGGGGGRRW